jgi:S1-C subfamily serine protease
MARRYTFNYLVPVLLTGLCLGCTPKRERPQALDLEALCQRSFAALPTDQVKERALDSVVTVEVVRKGAGCGFFQQFAGTGVIIDSERGLVLTAAHVVAGAARIDLTTVRWDGERWKSQATMEAVVLVLDHQLDAAVLMVKHERRLPPAIPLACRQLLFAGKPVVQFGRTSRMSLGRILKGVILAHPVTGALGFRVRTTAVAQPGDSGGPVLTTDGRLLGLVVMHHVETLDGYYTPLDSILDGLSRPSLPTP